MQIGGSDVTKRYWAIGVGNQWVEIRTATHPPQKVETVAEKAFDEKKEYWDSRYNDYRPRSVHKKFTIKTVIYKGGKAIFTLRRDRFRSASGRALDSGGILELSSTEAQKVIDCAKELGKLV